MVRTLCLALALLVILTPTALADEPNGEDSAAARLFREAWWLETGVGALDRAQARYEAAVAADGGDAVRARAMYRLAVVLHRMGKTETAVRTLEQLAAKFPAQTKYKDEAKARLEEWTGEDLKEAFADWYRRYQYSPEFQAKVVDLVLQLGVNDHAKSNVALNELSTIGEPALPALRIHAASANSNLADKCTRLLFTLGEVPPTEGLVRTSGWIQYGLWSHLMQASEADRDRVRAELEGDERWLSRLVRSALVGRAELLLTILDHGQNPMPGPLDWALAEPLAEALLARTHAVIDDPGANPQLRTALATALRPARGQLDRDTLVRWARSDLESVRKVVWTRFAFPSLQAPDTWRTIARLFRERQTAPPEADTIAMTNALFFACTHAPDDDDPAEMVETLNHAIGWYRFGSALYGAERSIVESVFARRALAAYVAQAQGEGSSMALAVWARAAGRSEDQAEAVFDRCVEWAAGAEHLEIRHAAMSYATLRCRWAPHRLLAPLRSDPARTAELYAGFFSALQRNVVGLLGAEWTLDDLALLVRTLGEDQYGRGGPVVSIQIGGVSHAVSSPYGGDVGAVFLRFFCDETKRDQLFEVAASDPAAFPVPLMSLLPSEFARTSAGRPIGLDVAEQHWDQWTSDQRSAAMRLFLVGQAFPEAFNSLRDTFLRAKLEQLDGGKHRILAVEMLNYLAGVTLDDIKTVYDLDDPDDAGVATQSWLNLLDREPETYDAFLAVLDPKAKRSAPVMTLYSRFQARLLTSAWDDRETDFIRRALANGGEDAAKYALTQLHNRSSIADMAFWLAALAHPEGLIRKSAATGLGSIYNDTAIRALANAVDDTDPRVRDAALESLERIKEIEEQKAYWKKFAEDKKEDR